jgi:predicted porin
MQSTIARTAIVAAALAACGAAQAQSSVTIYGIVSTDYVHATNTPTGKINKIEPGRVNPARLGFKGSEDLGGGLSAVFNLESAIGPDTGSAGAPFWGRGANVGLSSSTLGTVTAGRHWNINDDLLGNFFVFGGFAVFNYTGFGFTSDLVNNSVKYVSPNLAGLSVEALFGAGEGSTTNPRTVEVGGVYAFGPVKLGLTYHEAKRVGLVNKLTACGVAYSLGSVTLRGGYAAADNEYDDYSLVAGAYKAASYDIGADIGFGPASVSVDYVARDLKSSGNDSHFFRVLGKYNLSKRTQLNANVVLMKNKALAAESFYGLSAPGAKQNVFTLGLSHAF